MEDILSFLSKILSALGQILVLGWNILKFLLSKVWKFILGLGSLILGLFAIKKIRNKEDSNEI